MWKKFKCSTLKMGKTMLQLETSWHQVKLHVRNRLHLVGLFAKEVTEEKEYNQTTLYIFKQKNIWLIKLYQYIYSWHIGWNGSICVMNQVTEIHFAKNKISSRWGLWLKKDIVHSCMFWLLDQSVLHGEF